MSIQIGLVFPSTLTVDTEMRTGSTTPNTPDSCPRLHPR